MMRYLSRRTFLVSLTAATAARWPGALAALPAMHTRLISAGGERLPVIGMGSYITFNVGRDRTMRDARASVLQAFFDAGGALVDSSPMYGSSEAVIGYGLGRAADRGRLFSATKVWTPLQSHGIAQMKKSETLWGEKRFDLLQIHNLLNWEAHLETLLDWKARGRVRYIGITTSHGRRHRDFEAIMAAKPIDFVQFTYNMIDRKAEQRLLPLAAEKGLAVIINRPFQRGGLFRAFASKPLPGWAKAIGADNWAQIFLKFVVSHPAVTLAIPATSRLGHMEENMGAGLGPMPDEAFRRRMARHVEGL
ncbi:MAG: aldo/keto reductase [Rhodospirillales bacterium]|jgi:diketogulonate reductase-like aldo/keto reductase